MSTGKKSYIIIVILVMAKGDPRGLNKGRSSKFHEGSPEEGQRTY